MNTMKHHGLSKTKLTDLQKVILKKLNIGSKLWYRNLHYKSICSRYCEQIAPLCLQNNLKNKQKRSLRDLNRPNGYNLNISCIYLPSF